MPEKVARGYKTRCLMDFETSFGVAPTTHTLDAVNALRDDEALPSLPREAALKNAPEQNGRRPGMIYMSDLAKQHGV